MSDFKNLIDEETKKFIGYAKELAELEINFRTYTLERLSEESYKKASDEYSFAIKTIKTNISDTENKISEITEKTSYVSEDTLNELNIQIGRIWRIITANRTFCNEYGGVSFTNEPVENLYKEIYDKHLEELNEFMYDFIRVSNQLFSK